MTTAPPDLAAWNDPFVRANSPGPRICIIDQVTIPPGNDQDPAPHYASHSYADYMQWRDDNGIGPADAWTPWLTYDEWAMIMPPPLPGPPQPNPPAGWLPRVRVVPNGISQMDGALSGLLHYSFVTKTRHVPTTTPTIWVGGTQTRITLVGNGLTLVDMYIGVCNQVGDAASGWIATELHQLMFGGLPQCILNGTMVSDPLPEGLDGSTGFLVSGYVIDGTGTLGTRAVETEWYARTAWGNFAAQFDKSDASVWIPATRSSFGLLMIEGYYPPLSTRLPGI